LVWNSGIKYQQVYDTTLVGALKSQQAAPNVAHVSLPRLYTPERVAEELGYLSPFTIRRLVAKGKVPSIRGARGEVLFTEDLVMEMLRILTVGPEEADEDSSPEVDDDAFLFATTSRSRARTRTRKF
jgi:hypothetical protein